METVWKHNGFLQGPKTEGNNGKNNQTNVDIVHKNTVGQHREKLTEIRFKNIICASGTPFCMSSSIAWLAELPTSQ